MEKQPEVRYFLLTFSPTVQFVKIFITTKWKFGKHSFCFLFNIVLYTYLYFAFSSEDLSRTILCHFQAWPETLWGKYISMYIYFTEQSQKSDQSANCQVWVLNYKDAGIIYHDFLIKLRAIYIFTALQELPYPSGCVYARRCLAICYSWS